MAQKCQIYLVLFNSASVICNADKGNPSLFNFHGNSAGFGVYGIFHQFFYHGRRAFHHFSGCNFINGLLI